MKNKTLLFLIITFVIMLIHVNVQADANEIEITNQEEFATAITQINNTSNEEFVLKIKNNITINSATLFPSGIIIKNNNTVTIVGDNVKLIIGLTGKRFDVSSAIVNLGKENEENALSIEGPGEGVQLNESMFNVSNGMLNMYNGVSISKNYSTMHFVGCAVRVLDGATFNMYGGSINNNACTGSLGLGGAVALDGYNGTGTFNMYGGEIKNNEAGQWGGAIYVSTGSVVNITGGTISNNKGLYGGAISNLNSTVNISGAVLENNKASYGGAILNYSAGNLTVKNSTLKGNTTNSATAVSGYGGAIMCWGNNHIIEGNTIENNSSKNGGGIFGYSGTLNLKNNVIKGNSATNGGGIFNQANMISDNDEITLNVASSAGGGVVLQVGSNDLSTTLVYNNKADAIASDYYITSSVSSVKIMEAADFNKSMNIDNKELPINGWYTDLDEDRYSSTNYTERVLASNVASGSEFFLIAAANDYELKFDDDGIISTDNALRRLTKGSKIKINANGGISNLDEVELTNDVTIDNPTREGYKFKGWSTEDVDGYAFGLKANWHKIETYTVTFKIVNGKWSDGSTDDITLEITENDEEKVILKTTDIPTGMTANEKFENGTWDKNVTSDVEITENTTYTYSYTAVPKKKYTVTFKVVNGKWPDGSTDDIILEITENDEEKVILKTTDIPTGMTANEKFENGTWDKNVTSDVEITENTTYTYSYTAVPKKKYTVTFKVVNGKWSDGSTDDITLEITENDEEKVILKTTDIPTGMTANGNYENGTWDKNVISNVEITENTTYVFTFVEVENNNDIEEPVDEPKEEKTEEITEESKEEIKEETTKTDDNKPSNPKTGDNVIIYYVVFVISAYLLLKTKNKNKRRPKHLKNRH